MTDHEIRQEVRRAYAAIAEKGSSCCDAAPDNTAKTTCCAPVESSEPLAAPSSCGYTPEDLESLPQGADLGLGSGNPTALADLKSGERVLDLGSGAGIDVFLAARQVGPKGRAIGVDMTPAMLDKARQNAKTSGYENVEFRLGEIEHLPVADSSVDVVISNCVINLSPDKPRVFREAWRVLAPGGRMILSDLVLLEPLPDDIRNSVESYVGCVAGASQRDDYLSSIRAAGFDKVEILKETEHASDDSRRPTLASVLVRAQKS